MDDPDRQDGVEAVSGPQAKVAQVMAAELASCSVASAGGGDVGLAGVHADVFDRGQVSDDVGRAAAEVEQPLAGTGAQMLGHEHAARVLGPEGALDERVDGRLGEGAAQTPVELGHRATMPQRSRCYPARRRMPLPQYVAGLAFFLATLGAVGLGARLVLLRHTAHLTGAPRVLAGALIFTAGVIVAHVVPLALGVLSRGTVLAAAVLGAVVAWLVPAGRAPIAASTGAHGAEAAGRRLTAAGASTAGTARGSGTSASTGLSASTVIAVLAVASATVYELARLRGVALALPNDIDVMNFHLPGVARWVQSGSLWQIDQLFPFFVTGYYPNNGDAITLAAVLPWRMAAFARYVEVPFIALTGAAVYALARELRAPRTTAATFAAALIVLPPLADYSLEALPDVILLFAFGCGTLLLVRHARTGRRSELVLAGVGLGVAFGTKWYGVTSVAAVLATWGAMAIFVRRGVARTLREGAALVAVVLLCGGIWLVRNVVEAGNPLFPQKFRVLGTQLFPAPHNGILDRVGFTILGYLGKPHVLSHYILPGLRMRLGLSGLLFGVGVLAAIALAVRSIRAAPRRASLDHALLGVAVASVGVALLYAGTPGSAFGSQDRPVQFTTTLRWFVPAPVLGAAVAAAVAGRLGRWRLAVEVLGLAAVIDGIHRGVPVPASAFGEVLAALALLGAVCWLAWRWLDGWRPGWAGGGPGSAGRMRLAIALLVAVLVVAVGGRADEQSFLGRHYDAGEPPIAWVAQRAQAGHHRIGLAGIWSVSGLSPVFPSFGPRLRNEVVYVGPVVESLLREYRSAGPFQTAVRRGRFDLLLIGRGQPELPRAPEERWARGLGFTLISQSRRLALYRAPGAAARGGG